MPRSFRAKSRPRRANTIVQMVLVMPMLLMLGFGIVEYSTFIYVKGQVQTATREGAREAIRPTATNTTVQSAISTAMTSSGLQGSGYTITLSPPNMTGLPTGQAITVTVSCNWGGAALHALPSAMGTIPDSKPITCTVVMNRE